MKKMILILVLGLLWCNVGYGASAYKISALVDDGDIIIYKVKKPFLKMNNKKFQATYLAMIEDAVVRCQKSGDRNILPILFYMGNTIDADYNAVTSSKYRFYCGNFNLDHDSYNQIDAGLSELYSNWKRNYGDIFNSQISEVTHYSLLVHPVKKIPEKIVENKGKVKLASMIGEAKDTCKELGFTEGTDKFADCSLKLYSQSVELAAKNNQTVVMQPQSSGSNSITIYDPVRDSNALIRQGQRMLSGACTLGIDC